MNWEILKGQARHLLGLAGGVLIGVGIATADDVNNILGQYDAIVGGIMSVVAFGLSAVAKIKDLFNPKA